MMGNMTRFGYTLMTEQSGPRDLVSWAIGAEEAGFAGATQFVREEDVADTIPCGPDLDQIVEAVREFVDAGYTDVAVVQIGGDHQREFLDTAARPLLEKLRAMD